LRWLKEGIEGYEGKERKRRLMIERIKHGNKGSSRQAISILLDTGGTIILYYSSSDPEFCRGGVEKMD
jgi:hypothetical protein